MESLPYHPNQRENLRVDPADIKLHFYTNDKTQSKILSTDSLNDLLQSNYYNHSVKNVFMLHGWAETYTPYGIITQAIFESGAQANVFEVDWTVVTEEFYPINYALVVWKMPFVGKIVANYIDQMIAHFMLLILS